jgi:hypothetical protein
MATKYGSDIFAPELPIENLVLRAHGVLERRGLIREPNPTVWVDDHDADEPIPEYAATSIEDAARYLSQWPYPGALSYTLEHAPKDPTNRATGYVVRVYYSPKEDLSLLGFAFIGDVFKPNRYPDTLPVITSLVEALHEEFSAYRSTFAWGLEGHYVEDDEALALASGRAEPRPGQWLDIIDKGLVTTELLDEYQAAMETGSVLRRTSNGSLFWQRDAGPP